MKYILGTALAGIGLVVGGIGLVVVLLGFWIESAGNALGDY